jgi:hypothetical protein
MEDRVKPFALELGGVNGSIVGMRSELATVVVKRIATRRGGTVEGEETAASFGQLNAQVPVFPCADKRRRGRREDVVKSNRGQELLARGREGGLLKEGSGGDL